VTMARTKAATEIEAGLRLLNPDGSFEIRVFDRDGKARSRRFSPRKWLDAAAYAAQLDTEDWSGVYVTLNPLNSSQGPACDVDVDRWRWLYLDVDPDRIGPGGEILSGIPATDAEALAAQRVFEAIFAFLEKRGLACPLVQFTGNGYAGYVPFDLPNNREAKELIERLLRGLAKVPDSDGATLDLSCSNAARVTRIPGTLNRKEGATGERPHRRARLLRHTKTYAAVPEAKLRALADELCPPEPPRAFVLRTGRRTVGLLPGDDYDRNGPDFGELLEPKGWKLVRGTWDKGYLCRPGKESGVSATTICRGQHGEPLFYCWSSNAPPFPHRKSFGKFRTLALLKHGGNFSKAAKELYAAGWGERINGDGNQDTSASDPKEDESTTNDGSPPHSEDSGDCGPWGEVVPLGESPDVAPFPFELLPEALRPMVTDGARAYNCPPDYIGVPMLAVAGGAIGNSRHLAITKTHIQTACVFAGYVGRPGTTKTTPLRMVRRPLDAAQELFLADWRAKVEEWERQDEETRGDRPSARRCIVSDTTTEALGVTLTENPRGVVMVRNELYGLVTGLNQYKNGKGHDRQVYLDLWDGNTLIIDRKAENKSRGGAPLYVSDPFCAIVGTLQPDVLGRLRGETIRGVPPPDDGFIDRFLLAYPADVPAVGEDWTEVPEEATAAWAAAVENLLSLQMVADSERRRPYFLRLKPDGRREWERFTNAHAAEINDESFPSHLRGPWAKLKGYCARLALVLQLLRRACGETRDDDVDGESLRRAVMLVDYFKAHARKVWSEMDVDPKLRVARKVVRWLRGSGLSRFTKRDAYQALKGTFKTVVDLEPVLGLVEKHSFIRAEPAVKQDKAGRPPSPGYQVHPSLRASKDHNPHNAHNGGSD
jgi:Protein of unknown function (DUF3987)